MRYKLGEIFNLQMGKTPDRHSPKFWNEGTEPWISIADLTKCIKYIENTAEKITATAVDESGIKIIPKNTVIMSFKLSIGKVAITPKEMYSNEAIMSFIDKGVLKIEPVYLYYLLMHKDWDTDTNKAVMGKTLNKATLSQMTVNIHGYSEQLEIIKALDAASSIIAARKQQLTELDNLIKARFVEMFGDPELNPRGLPVLPWNAVFLTTTGKLDSNAMVENGRYPFFTCAKESYKIDSYAFDCEALLLAGNNAAGIYDVKHYKGKFNAYQRTYVLRLMNEKWSYILFKRQLEDKLQYLQSQSKGTNTRYLTLGILNELRFVVPPVAEQEQFAVFVEQTDKSKVAVQKALDEAQLLFDSLMQKYFG